MNAKKILKTLGYLPKWAWYLLSFFVAGPFGILGVYLVFHVLNKMVQEADAQPQTERRAQTAYEDAECTVVSDEEIERRWQKTQASAAQANARSDEPFFSEDADAAEVVRAGQDAMRRIRHANDIIADEALSAQIDSIENSCAQILNILAQRPQLLSQLRTFLRYYLPATLSLLESRSKLENEVNAGQSQAIAGRIREAMAQVQTAFHRQLQALEELRFINLESEMDVLADMLRSDGLTEEMPEDGGLAQERRGAEREDPFSGLFTPGR